MINLRSGDAPTPAIEVSHLTVSYGPSPALLDVSVSIPAGTLVGVIGPNGSGKSTLIKSILGFLKPDFGQVRIYGQPADEAKGRVAYVPQRGSVDWDFPITVREVAMMGRYGHIRWWRDPSAEDRRIADEALAMVRMSDFRERQIGQLSGGQQQRVFMARAMAQGAEILLLDEPFAGVDAATERAILDVLERTKAAGRTLVVVHHDLATATEYFDSLILLKQRLYAYGPPESVLEPELLSEVYEGKLRSFTDLLKPRGARVIDSLYTIFIEPLSQPFFQKAMLGGTLVAIVCGVIGCFVILRRMAFLGDALSHAMLAGVTGGYLLMQFYYGKAANAPAMLVGSLLAALITVGMIGFISRVSRIKEDTAIGIMYTGVFAAGGILASVFAHRIHVDLLHFVMGQVLAVNDTDLWVAGIVASVVLSAVLIFYRQLQLTSFDPVMAASIGVPVLAIDYLLTTCTSLVVVSAVTMVGVILVVGLLVTPAASAYLLCDRLSRMLVVSAALGATSVIGGLYTSLWCNIAGGASIVAFCTGQFLIVLVVAPRYGLIASWLRRAQMVPQPLVEDVLTSILRAGDAHPTLEQIQSKVEARPEAVAKALRTLARQNLVEDTDRRYRLTETGHREAQRVLRAHRLWEAYLEHVGAPETEIHARAHQLEHVHDPAAVDYIDDKLGHPLRDPHGKEIPVDIETVAPGKVVKLSQLREGHCAHVVAVGPVAENALLHPGVAIRLGPRQQNGNMWTVELTDGRKIALPHAAADAVSVEVSATPEVLPAKHANYAK